MKIRKHIKSAIDELIAISLNNGVQPSDFADNIFEEPYRDVKILRLKDSIKMTASFSDNDDMSNNTIVTMRYTYSLRKQLLKVEQKIGKSPFKLQWDRDQAVSSLVEKIARLLREENSAEEVEVAMNTIPMEMQVDLIRKLQLVA